MLESAFHSRSHILRPWKLEAYSENPVFHVCIILYIYLTLQLLTIKETGCYKFWLSGTPGFDKTRSLYHGIAPPRLLCFILCEKFVYIYKHIQYIQCICIIYMYISIYITGNVSGLLRDQRAPRYPVISPIYQYTVGV